MASEPGGPKKDVDFLPTAVYDAVKEIATFDAELAKITKEYPGYAELKREREKARMELFGEIHQATADGELAYDKAMQIYKAYKKAREIISDITQQQLEEFIVAHLCEGRCLELNVNKRHGTDVNKKERLPVGVIPENENVTIMAVYHEGKGVFPELLVPLIMDGTSDEVSIRVKMDGEYGLTLIGTRLLSELPKI